jgi:ankyrin repeat protein
MIWEAIFDNNDDYLRRLLMMNTERLGPAGMTTLLAQRSADGETPVTQAALAGSGVMVRLLCQNGAPADAKNEGGDTPLHIAALDGNDVVVRELVKLGADTSIVDRECGYNALHCAAQNGDVDTIRLLAPRSAIDARTKDKRTALHVAADMGRTAAVKALLEFRCPPRLRDDEGCTALHYAANKGHGDIARALIEAGEDVNLADNDGETPLHLASSGGHAGMITLLKSAGAKLSVRDKEGYTPYEVAKMSNKDQHAKLRSLLFDPALAGGAKRAPGAGPAKQQPGKGKQQQEKARNGGKPAAATNAGGKGAAGGGKPGAGGGGGGGNKAPAAGGGKPAGGAGAGSGKPSSSAVSAELTAWLRNQQLADAILPLCAQLGLASLSDVVHVREDDLTSVPVVQRRKFVAAARLVAAGAAPAGPAKGGGGGGGGYKPLPFPSVDNAKSFDAHAETIAVTYMRQALGYTDAKVNGGIHTPDGGIDVVSSKAVAQVKANFRSGAIKRGPITQLIGDATAPSPYAGRRLLFFAVSYTDDAIRAARERDVRLFTMDSRGVVTAV